MNSLNGSFSLNFDKFPAFYEKLKEDSLKNLFSKHINKEEIIKDLNAYKKQDKILAGSEDEYSASVKHVITRLNNRIEKESEGDHLGIHAVVCDILGIQNSKIYQENFQDCQKCVDLMKQTGFLEISSKELADFHYHPGEVAQAFLNTHPEVKSIAIGCGESIKDNPGSCYYSSKEMPDLHDRAMSINISPLSKPDVISDMHDKRLWEKLPSNYFTEIVDHTMGNFLFENEETMQQIHRVLKPEGKLRFYHIILSDQNVSVLLKNGFSQMDDNTFVKKT